MSFPDGWAQSLVPFPSCQQPRSSIPTTGTDFHVICIWPISWRLQFLAINPQKCQESGYLNSPYSPDKQLISGNFTPKPSTSPRHVLSVLATRNVCQLRHRHLLQPTNHTTDLGRHLAANPVCAPQSPSLRSSGWLVSTLPRKTFHCRMCNFMINSASAKLGANREKKNHPPHQEKLDSTLTTASQRTLTSLIKPYE